MSNMLTVRRVKVQNLDEQGNPIGEPTYGVMAADSYESAYDDTFESFAELNTAIREAGSILAIVQGGDAFSDVATVVGTDNYQGPCRSVFDDTKEDEDSHDAI